jgi:hypothetical protein
MPEGEKMAMRAILPPLPTAGPRAIDNPGTGHGEPASARHDRYPNAPYRMRLRHP